jgi:hypothetical protein
MRPSRPVQAGVATVLERVRNGPIDHDFVCVGTEGEDFEGLMLAGGYLLPQAFTEGEDL